MTLFSPLARLAFCTASVLLASALRAEDHTPPSRTGAAAAIKPAARVVAAVNPDQLAKGLLTLGANLTDREDYAAAEIAFREILDHRNFTPADRNSALLGLARMYRKQGTYIKAAAIYEKFLKDNPDDERNPDVFLDLGRTLRSMGAHKLALNRFYVVINSTLKLGSDGFAHYQQLARTAQFEIAETHYEAGEFAEASKFFLRLRLLDLAPADRARAHFKAACAQQLDHDNEAAVTTLRAFLEQWPGDENVPEARYLLATTLRQLNRSQEALTTTLELLQTEHSKTAPDSRRWIYWQRRTGNQLANEFFQNGDTSSALAIYQGLATFSPELGWRLPVVYQIGLCHERLRQTDQARAAYQSICDLTKPAEGTPAPTAELSELARMATWRLGQLAWRDSTDQRLNAYFDTSTGRSSPPSPPASKHDPDGRPSATPAAL